VDTVKRVGAPLEAFKKCCSGAINTSGWSAIIIPSLRRTRYVRNSARSPGDSELVECIKYRR